MTTKDYLYQALKENGLEGGAMAFDPPTAGKVIRRYKELLEMDKNKVRNHLSNKFAALHVGDMPEIQTSPLNDDHK